MKTKKQILKALEITGKLRIIVEDSFKKVPMSPETPRVFFFQCNKCKDGFGSAEMLNHLQKKHKLPYFITGEEALRWVIE